MTYRTAVACALIAAAAAAGGVHAQAKPPSADAAITARVERVLTQDAYLGRMDIRVETREGIVSLTGFVSSVADITKAGELARAAAGVSGVRNGLRVADRPSRA